MPRPSDFIQRLLKEAHLFDQRDVRDFGRWLDSIEGQSDISTQKLIGGIGSALANEPYLTIANSTALTAERTLVVDSSLTLVDGGANSTATLSVTASGHTHPERDIIETNYLVVDAGGFGDFTTIQAAIDHIKAVTTNGQRWTVVIRAGSYTETISTSLTSAYNSVSIEIIGMGEVVVIGSVTMGSYGVKRIRRILFTGTLAQSNGGVSSFYDCTFTNNAGNVYASAGVVLFYRCIFTQTSGGTASLIGSGAVNNSTVTAYQCIFNGHSTAATVQPGLGSSYTLIGCVVTNGGSGLHLFSGSPTTLIVGRSLYDRSKTSGTITILDGDTPDADTLDGHHASDFALTSDLPVVAYGSMYADDITQAVTVSSAGGYFEVGGGMTAGLCDGFALQSSKELLCSVAGTYLAVWSMSIRNSNSDNTVSGAVMINSTDAHQTENATRAKENGVVYSLSGSNPITLAVNDVVKLCVENETATSTVTVTHANLSLLRLGA